MSSGGVDYGDTVNGQQFISDGLAVGTIVNTSALQLGDDGTVMGTIVNSLGT